MLKTIYSMENIAYFTPPPQMYFNYDTPTTVQMEPPLTVLATKLPLFFSTMPLPSDQIFEDIFEPPFFNT